MLTALRQGRVAGLRVTVACARSLDEMPHDVYLLDLSLPDQRAAGGGRFDEVPYLECLEPVLDAVGGPPSWVLDVSRTHRSDRDGVGLAHLSALLTVGRAPSAVEPAQDLTAAVQAAFAQMAHPQTPEPRAVEPSVAEPSVAEPSVAEPSVAEPSVAEPRAAAAALSRSEAVAAATAAVADTFPGVDPQALSVTDEEHHAAEGRWFLGLALPEVARFEVRLGFVPGAPASAHVRRRPVGEVVDSVGT